MNVKVSRMLKISVGQNPAFFCTEYYSFIVKLFGRNEHDIHTRYKFRLNTTVLLYRYTYGNMFRLY